MNRALLELLARSLRGRLLRMARLVRQPKYLLGSIIGLGYLAWFVARPFLTGGEVMSEFTLEEMPRGFVLGLHVLASLAMAVYLSVTWTLFPAKPSLRLNEHELQLLLPAPISRRQIIQFALAKSLPGILIGVVVILVLFSSGTVGERLVRGAGVFLLFVLWDLHGKGRNLWRMHLADLPPSRALPRRVVMIGAIVVFWVVAATGVTEVVREAIRVFQASPEVDEDVLQEVAAAGAAVLERGWFRVLLTPFLLIVGPLLGGGVYSLPLSWLALVGLVAAHYLWVVNSQARFEDALLERERQRAAEGPKRKGRARLQLSSRRRAEAPFHLRPGGRPETAIFWKDLLVVTRRPAAWLASWGVAACAAAGVVAVATSRYPGVAEILGTASVAVALGTPLLTSTIWSNGFRRDLKHFELLRTWPVAAYRLVLGQVMAPWLQAAAMVVAGFAVFLAVDTGTRVAAGLGFRETAGILPPGLTDRVDVPSGVLPWVGAVTLAPLLIAVAAFASSLECLAALAFPGWLISFDRHRGDPAAMGNRILVVIAFGLIMLLAVLPVAIALGIVALVHAALGAPFVVWELPFLGLLAAAPILFETYLVIRAAGRLWVNLDPSQELLEGFS